MKYLGQILLGSVIFYIVFTVFNKGLNSFEPPPNTLQSLQAELVYQQAVNRLEYSILSEESRCRIEKLEQHVEWLERNHKLEGEISSPRSNKAFPCTSTVAQDRQRLQELLKFKDYYLENGL